MTEIRRTLSSLINNDNPMVNDMILLDCQIIKLPKIADPRGNLTFIESYNHIPFEIKRLYYLYDVPGGEKLDGYACLNNEDFVIALSGSFDVVLDNGKEKSRYHLNRPDYGLYMTQMHWCEMDNFSTNSLALIISSAEFDEKNYIRHYADFLKEVNIRQS